MDINVTKIEQLAKVALNGRFDFTAHRAFRSAYEEAFGFADITEVAVDMDGVDYLDSSALGMLLIMRDKAQAAGKKIKLMNCRGTVAEVLRVANFDKLFTIV
jgi:anti-anti-sigma factor